MFRPLRKLLLEQCASSRYSGDDDLVFPDAFGKAMLPNSFIKYGFYAALKGAGVRFRFHDLRHFAVSQLIRRGANVLQVARVAGHADPSITLRVYSHLMADGLTEAAERYDPLRTLSVDAG